MTWTHTELKKILRDVRLQMKGTNSSDVFVRGWRQALREIEWVLDAQVEKEKLQDRVET